MRSIKSNWNEGNSKVEKTDHRGFSAEKFLFKMCKKGSRQRAFSNSGYDISNRKTVRNLTWGNFTALLRTLDPRFALAHVEKLRFHVPYSTSRQQTVCSLFSKGGPRGFFPTLVLALSRPGSNSFFCVFFGPGLLRRKRCLQQLI
ncbi:hypothetical protein O181_033105 [Austropuccinia psidii MF-1]|uniref:Uncharacterized protein n=1 Tax=Austropuccinia psidii MF-1 TaxID=1389203 RepID=A0A9Q3H8W4_9BASI|nr:hypothetical protein [Austropuccinia psidii MF-1]